MKGLKMFVPTPVDEAYLSIAYHTDLLEKSLKASKGQPAMADPEVKLAIIALWKLSQSQHVLIRDLTKELQTMKARSLIQRLLNK